MFNRKSTEALRRATNAQTDASYAAHKAEDAMELSLKLEKEQGHLYLCVAALALLLLGVLWLRTDG